MTHSFAVPKGGERFVEEWTNALDRAFQCLAANDLPSSSIDMEHADKAVTLFASKEVRGALVRFPVYRQTVTTPGTYVDGELAKPGVRFEWFRRNWHGRDPQLCPETIEECVSSVMCGAGEIFDGYPTDRGTGWGVYLGFSLATAGMLSAAATDALRKEMARIVAVLDSPGDNSIATRIWNIAGPWVR